MTWVRMDPRSVYTAITRIEQVARDAVPLIQAVPSIGAAGGLGDLGPATDDLAGTSGRVFDEAFSDFLHEAIDVLERLIALTQDQQAGSVVGAVGASVGGVGAEIVGATAVGGGSGFAPSLVTVGGAPGSSADVIFGPPATITIGGEPSYANDPLMRAAIAAQERGDTALAGQFLGVQSSINESRNRTISLITAPSGARAMGPYGPSAGFRAFGSHLEVPI